MVAARILDPFEARHRPGAGRHRGTLAEELSRRWTRTPVRIDGLAARAQDRIERGLAKRHLGEGTLVLYDLTSVWMEGRTCPLAKRGHSRDGKRGKLEFAVAVTDVPCRSPATPPTPVRQVGKLRQRFGLSRVVLVGDRSPRRESVKKSIRQRVAGAGHPRAGGVRGGATVAATRDLVQVTSDAYPGERLMVSPQSAAGRGAREEARGVARRHRGGARTHWRGDPAREAAPERREQDWGAGGQGHRRYKMAKHFEWSIDEKEGFTYRRNASSTAEAALDGLYVVRTSCPRPRFAPGTVRAYKRLSTVERAFRSLIDRGPQGPPGLPSQRRASPRPVLLCCWPTTWNGTCASGSARCCSTTRTARRPRPHARPSWHRPKCRTPHRPRPGPSAAEGDPVRASAPCSPTSPPSPATPWRRACPGPFEVITRPTPLQDKALKLLGVRLSCSQ